MPSNMVWLCANPEVNWAAASVFVAVVVFLWVELGKKRDRKAASILAGILMIKDLKEVAEVSRQLQITTDPGGEGDFRVKQPVLEKEVIQHAITLIDGLAFSVMGRQLPDLVTLPATVSQPAARCLLAMSEAKKELGTFLQPRFPVSRPATRSELGRARGHLMGAELGAENAIEAAENIDVFMGQLRLELRRRSRRALARVRIWIAIHRMRRRDRESS